MLRVKVSSHISFQFFEKRKRFTAMPFKFGFFFSTILSYILLCAAQVADVSLFGR